MSKIHENITEVSPKESLRAVKKRHAYLNKLCCSPLESDQRLYRLYRAAECCHPSELAAFFEVNTASVHKVKKSGKIPAVWLLMLFQVKNVFPEWILTGNGSMYLEKSIEGRYENGHTFLEHQEIHKVLRFLPSYVLAEELLRRISREQMETLC